MMWLDMAKEMRNHESVAYKPITGKHDTQLGINKGSPAFLLDDPDGDTSSPSIWEVIGKAAAGASGGWPFRYSSTKCRSSQPAWAAEPG